MKKIYKVLTIILLLLLVAAGFWFWQSRQPAQLIVGEYSNMEIFLDVRTDQEWVEGHLSGAVHFELARLQNGELPDLPKDKDIAVYCRTGRRAEEAVRILESKGYTNVRNAGGLADLQAQGQKICVGEAAFCN